MSKRSASASLFVLLMLACVPGFSQSRFELQPFVGYKFGGSTPIESKVKLPAVNITSLSFDSSVNYGVSFGVNATSFVGLEFLWNRQPTKAVGTLSTGQVYDQKLDVNIDQYHGNLLIHFTDQESKLRPYFLVGVGGTRAAGASSSVSKIGYGLGGGVKYWFTKNMGVRAQVRYAPTYLYSTLGGVWCNWWGGCWVVPNDHFVNQGDATIGWTFGF